MRIPMRDAFLAVLATCLGFATVVLLRGQADPLVWAPFVVSGLVLLAVAAVDARRSPVVLLVAESSGAAGNRLESALAYEGVSVRRCTGPVENRCPVLAGERCPHGDGLAMALVHGGTGGGDDPPCRRGLDAPVTYYEVDARGPVLRGTARRDVASVVGTVVSA